MEIGGRGITKQKLLINSQIKNPEIRVIGSDGSQLGILSVTEALSMALEENLDLVMISPNAQPPVCRIMDYAKYNFEIMKREKEAKRKQKVVEIKEIRLSVNIDSHDFDTKISTALKLLKNGHKVKIVLRFKGREIVHPEIGKELLAKLEERTSEFGELEKSAKLDGKSMIMVISPKKIQKN